VIAACRVYGFSRQSYYKREQVREARERIYSAVLEKVHDYRREQCRIGVKKIHHMLSMEGIVIGRDRLYDLLRPLGLLVLPLRRHTWTTDSNHGYIHYPNLIKELAVSRPDQVWVSDITYIDTDAGFCYLSLITDKCARKIVGYHLDRRMTSEACLKALRMALSGVSKTEGIIHHSDRGRQYSAHVYTDYLKSLEMKISMTEENHCYENALAERVNGILKQEFGLGQRLPSFEIAKQMVEQAVLIYNNKRPHLALDYDFPAQKYAA